MCSVNETTNSTPYQSVTMWNFLNRLLSTKGVKTIRKTTKLELFQFEGRLVPTVSATVVNTHPTGSAHVVTTNQAAPTKAAIIAQVAADATRQAHAVSLSTVARDNRR